MERCTLCGHTVWPGQKLIRTHEGRAHRKCQRQAAEKASMPDAADYLRIPAAAVLKGITRESMRLIVQRGYLPAYCELCLQLLPIDSLRKNQPIPHNCPKATGQARSNVVVKKKDVEEYEVMKSRQDAGRLGGLARQKGD